MIAVFLFCAVFVLILYLLVFFYSQIQSNIANVSNKKTLAVKLSPITAHKKVVSKHSKVSDSWRNTRKVKFSHPWLLTTIKGHDLVITDISLSADDKYIISTAEDRSLFIWSTSSFFGFEKKSFVRHNLDFDYAKFVCWCPSGLAFVLLRYKDNLLQLFSFKKFDKSLTRPQYKLNFAKTDIASIVSLAIANSGHFVVAGFENGKLCVYDLNGAILINMDTLHGKLNSVRITPCSKHIFTCGFTSDVKVWLVKFPAATSRIELVRVYQLTAHSAAIIDVTFSADSYLAASVSNDCTWALYNINIDYKMDELPVLLHQEQFCKRNEKSGSLRIALSPDKSTLIVGYNINLNIYSAKTYKLILVINDLFSDGKYDFSDVFTSIVFDSTSKYFYVAGDRQIYAFHNVAYFIVMIEDLKQKLKLSLTSSTRNRLQDQLKQATVSLKQFNSGVDNN